MTSATVNRAIRRQTSQFDHNKDPNKLVSEMAGSRPAGLFVADLLVSAGKRRE
jgi:hypothetical protein